MEISLGSNRLSYWKGRRVFLTGHTGFKGSWMALMLSCLGAEVTGFSLPEDMDALAKQRGVSRKTHNVFGDIRNLSALASAVAAARPQVIFHLAAQALVRQSYRQPLETYSTNIMGTANLLEAARDIEGVSAIIVITTDKCYADREWEWGYREIDNLGGRDPYSSSKACAELAAASWRESYYSGEDAATVATARAGNVIGGGDWAEDRLVPDMIRAFSVGKKVPIRNPEAVRPWQHVLDPLNGYLMLAERATRNKNYGVAWNFGPSEDEDRTVRWVAEAFCRKWGECASWEQDAGTHPKETHALRLDCSKASRRLGWQPVLDVETALDWTAQWYKRHGAGESAFDVTYAQINDYIERMEG